MAINERAIPPEAAVANEAHEVFRGWLIDNRFVCTLLPTAFKDPGVWGVLLADAAHHIANALAESENADRAAVLTRITRAFNVEMRAPTDEHIGGFIEGG